MFVFGQKDMVVFGRLEFAITLEHERITGKCGHVLFFLCQILFLPAIGFLLHPSLVVGLYLTFNGFIERMKVKKLQVPQFGIYPGINQFYMVLYQSLIFWSF